MGSLSLQYFSLFEDKLLGSPARGRCGSQTMISLFGGRRGSRGQQTGVNSRDSQPDREEDGFVLLGETAIERSTVQYGQEQPGGTAPPPAYHQVATPQHLPPPVYSPPCTADTSSLTMPRSVLSDVPFSFSRHLAVAVGSQSQFRVPPLRTPDLSQYSYDFHVERSVLREAGLLEEWEWRRNSAKQAAITESMETEPARNDPTEETQDLMTFE